MPNISLDYIKNVVENSYREVSNRGYDLCNISSLRHGPEYYKNDIAKHIYAIRLSPAYYLEYCIMAYNLNHRLTELSYDTVNISSYGCGMGQDHQALTDNLNIPFNYIGYDTVDWWSSVFTPEGAIMINIPLSEAEEEILSQQDVHFFPKSLTDIPEADLNYFINSLAASKKERVFFLNSHVTASTESTGYLQPVRLIHNAMTQYGYHCTQDHERTYHLGDHYSALNLLDFSPKFMYPAGIPMPVCTKKDSEDEECQACDAGKYPILKNSHMSFQILEYYR